MTRLILIRHGETDYSAEKRYCGWSDPPLNNKGMLQAAILADRLNGLKIDKVYSSDLKRASESAQIIFTPLDSKHLTGFTTNPVEKTADFREINFGIFEGLNYKEIAKKRSGIYEDWIDNPAKVKIPGGESLSGLSKRVREKLSFILSRFKGGVIAVVAHGGPIRIILLDALKRGIEDFWQIEQAVCALNIIDYSHESAPCLIKMNDTSHLNMLRGVGI